MRLARLRVAAGQRLCTQACGGHAAAAPRLLPHACRGRLIARPCSAAADVERSAAPETPAASGYCAACAKTHSLPRTREADAAAEALLARIRASGRLDFDADVADLRFALQTKYRTLEAPKAQGQMLGVLLATDGAATHVLKAFSGQMNGAWLVPGWAPPLGGVRHDNSPMYTLAWRRIMALGTEAAEAQAEARALAGAAGLRKGWGADPAFAALEARREAAKSAQRAASRALLTRIWDSYAVRNFRGAAREEQGPPGDVAGSLRACADWALANAGEEKRLVQASLLGDATRGGTGDCCAPKLLHAAQQAGLRPLSMAEVWFGSSPPAGGRVEGQAYAACEERCAPLLGYMLCGLP